MKRIFSILLCSILMLMSLPVSADEAIVFKDVPQGHWAEESIYGLKKLNLIEGTSSDTFGLGSVITKGEFITYLEKVMNLNKNVVTNTVEDSTSLTRREMAEIVTKKLGYDEFIKNSKSLDNIFIDVKDDSKLISFVNDIGLITGNNKNEFKPDGIVTKEQAAVVLWRIHNKINTPISELHGFYAIKSYNQIEMIENISSVSFGWSRLEYDKSQNKVKLNTNIDGKNVFGIPKGSSEPFNTAKQNGKSTQLMVYADDSSVLNYVLTVEEGRKEAIKEIVGKVNSISLDNKSYSLDGVVIDFEGLKSEKYKLGLNAFLKELKEELNKNNKSLYVAVHPSRKAPLEYFDGYDFKFIGEVADRVILMAHDYYPTKLSEEERNRPFTVTPLTPIDEIYYSLKAITDKNTGVKDTNKVLLQISFDAVQWKLKDGKVINETPYHPTYEQIAKRLIEDKTVEKYYAYGNPYIKYHNTEDGTDNVIWYEDSRSVNEKIKLAKMFGVNKVSLWRLGNIPNYSDEGIYLNIFNDILSLNK